LLVVREQATIVEWDYGRRVHPKSGLPGYLKYFFF